MLTPNSDAFHTHSPCCSLAHRGIFFSQVFPNRREISRRKQTATHGVYHWLERSLPRGSIAMATGKKI